MRKQGDRLREEILAALDAKQVSRTRASLDAGLDKNRLGKFLRNEIHTLGPEACEAVARYFGWPVLLVHQWQGTLPASTVRSDARVRLAEDLAELLIDARERQPILDMVDLLRAARQRSEDPSSG